MISFLQTLEKKQLVSSLVLDNTISAPVVLFVVVISFSLLSVLCRNEMQTAPFILIRKRPPHLVCHYLCLIYYEESFDLSQHIVSRGNAR